jgi:protease IV
VYEQFKGRVMKSRGERLKKDLESMAGGRVYTGAQALELGLVDKLGGLADALDLAATKAGLPRDYTVQLVPKPSGIDAIVAMLRGLMGQEGKDEFEVAASAQIGCDPLLKAALPMIRQLAPAQAEEFVRCLQNLVTLRNEKVGCFMPLVPQIH